LHETGFRYKKPKVVPGKADPEAQQAFLRDYENLKQDKGENDPIYFMEGTHPQHNTVSSYGWIKRGEEKEIRSNSGRICDNARYYRSRKVDIIDHER